jgi:hypothetical protein
VTRKERKHGRTGALRGPDDVRRFLRDNATPVVFVSPTPFELLGIDRWVRRFRYLSAVDPFSGRHPHVRSPPLDPPAELEPAAEVCNRLLSHPEVVARLRSRGGGLVVPLSANEETTRLAADAGVELAVSTATLRGGAAPAVAAGVPQVPYVRGRASSYGVLQALAVSSGLGRDLVVQTGETTVVVASERDWLEHAGLLAGRELRVTTRIRSRPTMAVGVVTRHGTLVGPDLAEPGTGGAGQATCVLPAQQRDQARRVTRLVGEQLRRDGHRGWFELELLVDLDGDAVFAGEVQPRLTAACSLANVAAVARDDTPLVLFHLLEFLDVEHEIDVDELDARWAEVDPADGWGWLTVPEGAPSDEPIAAAPRSGVWRVEPDARAGIRCRRRELDWRSLEDESEAFFLRVARKGGRRRPGSSLGVVVARGTLHDPVRARTWIDGITGRYRDAVAVGA